MRKYRQGYRKIWLYAGDYCRKLKHFPKPGTLGPNQHAGVMPAMPGEFSLTGKQAATILEKCGPETGITYESFKAVSGCLSYLYQIQAKGDTGIDNFPEVRRIFKDWNKADFSAPQTSHKPDHIPSPQQLKVAFTKPWTRGCGWSLPKFFLGMLSCWAWAVLGSRPTGDMNSLKNSEAHTIDSEQGWCCTGFENGRNKLCGNKRGSRPWNGYRVYMLTLLGICLCPNGVHIKLPKNLTVDALGNPKKRFKFCTTCPVLAMEYKQQKEGAKPVKLFQKWSKTEKQYGSSSVGKPVDLAIEWLELQGVTAGDGNRFSTNGGRKALAAWLGELKVPYHEGFEIHGDLFDVWSDYYQLNCLNSNNFARRTQSADPYVCLAALRRLKHWFGREKKIETQQLNVETQMMVAFLQSQGQSEIARTVLARNGM